MDRNALMAALQEREIAFSIAMTDKQLEQLLGIKDVPFEPVVESTETEVAEILPPKKKGGRPKKTE